MKKRKAGTLVALVVIVAIVALFGIVYLTNQMNYGVIQGKIVDDYSQDVVKKVHLTIDGKSDVLFASKEYILSRIAPGKYTFQAVAPFYGTFTREVDIKKGINVLDFTMKGKEIPGLAGIICFADSTERGVEIEIRFKNDQGQGISDYPALPLTLEGKLFVREGDEKNYTRGRKVYEGPIELSWDPTSYLARNKGLISRDKIQIDPQKEPFGVMDLVLTTPQGTFQDVVDNVEFVKKEE
ncbi:MAG: hypothetical protein NTX88_08735 [Candidatus Atribacteria bacterium]|nr:hypothetical protein [Candidatus Atribacteria bacterium]